MHIRCEEINCKSRFKIQCVVKPWSNHKLLCWRHHLQFFDLKRINGNLNGSHSIVRVVNFPSWCIPLYLADIAFQPSLSHLFNLRHHRNLRRTITSPSRNTRNTSRNTRNTSHNTSSKLHNSCKTTSFQSPLNHWMCSWWPWLRGNRRISCLLHHELVEAP